MIKVVFVCLGNICRSPTAEGVFRALVEEEGLGARIAVDSAGTGAWHTGEAPDPRAQEAARRRGVDLSALRARKATKQDFSTFDYVLAMDLDNLAALKNLCPPGEEHRLALLLDYAPRAGRRDVPDPYYIGGQGFENVLDLIETASRGLLAHIPKDPFLGPSVLGDIAKTIGRLAGSPVAGFSPLGGGCIAAVYRVALEDGRALAAKVGDGLAVEGTMLRYLALNSRLPVPRVVHAGDELLVMDFIEAGDGIDRPAEVHAAELLADLHGITTDAFGFERATVIGGLEQPNPWTPGWLDFFRDQRLLYMGLQALDAGRLPGRLMKRLEVLAGRLDRWLEAPTAPSLLHGDMWTGNVLCRKGRIAGFVDPAVYYGDAEIELAFATLFNTFGAAFFERYGELRRLTAR